MKVVGLRSPYETVAGLVYFGRMLDKIRLQLQGKLPAEYEPLLGENSAQSFDGRCCRFLRINYAALKEQIPRSASDEEVFDWATAAGRKPNEGEIAVWNAFMQKRGWRDPSSASLRKRVEDAGMPVELVLTHFDYIDFDEERPLRFGADLVPSEILPQGILRVPGLRSPYEKVGGIVFFGRMLDKIRLFQKGKLPPAWVESKGGRTNIDGECCGFLGVDYQMLEEEVLQGRSDEVVLDWVQARAGTRSEEEIEIWNDYITKRCWRDQFTIRLQTRLTEEKMPLDAVATMFDFIDLDEGRPLLDRS